MAVRSAPWLEPHNQLVMRTASSSRLADRTMRGVQDTWWYELGGRRTGPGCLAEGEDEGHFIELADGDKRLTDRTVCRVQETSRAILDGGKPTRNSWGARTVSSNSWMARTVSSNSWMATRTSQYVRGCLFSLVCPLQLAGRGEHDVLSPVEPGASFQSRLPTSGKHNVISLSTS